MHALAPSASNIGSHELVGLHGRVVNASNPSMKGISGGIAYESKSMLLISTEHHGMRHIPKKHTLLRLWRTAGHMARGAEPICTVRCSTMLKRPCDRKGAAVTA